MLKPSKLSAGVVMAAGKSTRTYPLTLDVPKGLLRVCNKPILQYTLEALEPFVERFILVVNSRKEMIEAYFGDSFHGIPITYVHQDVVKFPGTGGAMMACREELSGEFLVIYGDDLYGPADVRSIAEGGLSLLGMNVEDPSKFGVLTTNDTGHVTGILEKPKLFVGNLANCGCYHFDDDIFTQDISVSARGEYELTDMFLQLAKRKPIKVLPVQEYWRPIGYPWDVLNANLWMLDHGTMDITRAFDPSVHMEGKVQIGENCVTGRQVKVIGPSVIGNNVTINDRTTVIRSVIEDGSMVGPDSIIQDSVIMAGYVMKPGVNHMQVIVSPQCTIVMN